MHILASMFIVAIVKMAHHSRQGTHSLATPYFHLAAGTATTQKQKQIFSLLCLYYYRSMQTRALSGMALAGGEPLFLLFSLCKGQPRCVVNSCHLSWPALPLPNSSSLIPALAVDEYSGTEFVQQHLYNLLQYSNFGNNN